jgi:hypothetical protein
MRFGCAAKGGRRAERAGLRPTLDIVAHGLWVAVGLAAASRRWPIPRRTAGLTVALAALPDLAQLLPLLGTLAIGSSSMAVLTAYATALPGLEPRLPLPVAALTHHLHCIMHSAIVAGAVTAVLWLRMRSLW